MFFRSKWGRPLGPPVGAPLLLDMGLIAGCFVNTTSICLQRQKNPSQPPAEPRVSRGAVDNLGDIAESGPHSAGLSQRAWPAAVLERERQLWRLRRGPPAAPPPLSPQRPFSCDGGDDEWRTTAPPLAATAPPLAAGLAQ